MSKQQSNLKVFSGRFVYHSLTYVVYIVSCASNASFYPHLALRLLSTSDATQTEIEWSGIFDIDDTAHFWSMQKVDGKYADQTMRIVAMPTATVTRVQMELQFSLADTLISGDCKIVEAGESISPIGDIGTCFELHVGTGDDSIYPMNTTGMTGLGIFAQHSPLEFERTRHYFFDTNDKDIEPVAQEFVSGGDGHDHGAFKSGSELNEDKPWGEAIAAAITVNLATLSGVFILPLMVYVGTPGE